MPYRTLIFHNYWAIDPAQVRELTNQTNHFFKNLTIMGALVFIIGMGSGPLSLSGSEKSIDAKEKQDQKLKREGRKEREGKVWKEYRQAMRFILEVATDAPTFHLSGHGAFLLLHLFRCSPRHAFAPFASFAFML